MKLCKDSVDPCKGVARILERGFVQVVDPRRGGLGVQPPDADDLLYTMRRKIITLVICIHPSISLYPSDGSFSPCTGAFTQLIHQQPNYTLS